MSKVEIKLHAEHLREAILDYVQKHVLTTWNRDDLSILSIKYNISYQEVVCGVVIEVPLREMV